MDNTKTNVFDILMERGFIAQTTNQEKIRELLGSGSATFYIGFDPTADSLHVGHLLQLIVMSHMQKAGHKPIALIGGGTAMVGDPTGKTDMRRMMTREEIQHNGDQFKVQMRNLVDFTNDRAIMVDNADWLLDLNYVNFLREVGVHFSVNRMLTAECFKSRLEKGLSFIEFNYMLMQSYDFLRLHREHNCLLQLGGDDQWSNILGGIDLIRRVEGKEVYGMTFQLLTTSDGKKMGKTEKGAVWLDPEKTSPYDFYQYWRNVQDADVINCLKLLTFVPMDRINEMVTWKDARINEAKKVLAYEVTAIVHGKEEADKAHKAAEAIFSKGVASDDMPSVTIERSVLKDGINILDLLTRTGLIPSKGEGRRLIQQGGLYLNNARVDTIDRRVNESDLEDSRIIIRKGKKSYFRIIAE
ncbi:MAG: tyrosine--tRNA ligase [Clostridiaceae bacterium]|jgi:tyrosyl-tRNA synthetase|nr:tyrosine--tRNA ligase [Bacillota bacterium]NLI38365.1 tyrosine--tRNA ligase [Clostridiaceae bacterium]